MYFKRFAQAAFAALLVGVFIAATAQPAAAQSCIIGNGPTGPIFGACPSSSSQSGYGQFQQDILLGNVGSITQTVRDQIHRRLIGNSAVVAPLRFTGEDLD